jgi:hypothetical protein
VGFGLKGGWCVAGGLNWRVWSGLDEEDEDGRTVERPKKANGSEEHPGILRS